MANKTSYLGKGTLSMKSGLWFFVPFLGFAWGLGIVEAVCPWQLAWYLPTMVLTLLGLLIVVDGITEGRENGENKKASDNEAAKAP